jgi:hypothetical protein
MTEADQRLYNLRTKINGCVIEIDVLRSKLASGKIGDPIEIQKARGRIMILAEQAKLWQAALDDIDLARRRQVGSEIRQRIRAQRRDNNNVMKGEAQ